MEKSCPTLAEVARLRRNKTAISASDKKGCSASCSRGNPSKVPPSYKIPPETFKKVRDVMNEDVSDTVAVLKALSDPIRVRILKALCVEKLCVCVFVELLNGKYSKLSYHLRLLKEAGLIECKQERNFLIYYLTEFGETVLRCLEEFHH